MNGSGSILEIHCFKDKTLLRHFLILLNKIPIGIWIGLNMKKASL
jgi:hypothetical protein